jgi:hypothetical protein
MRLVRTLAVFALLFAGISLPIEAAAQQEKASGQKVIKNAAEYNAYISALNTSEPDKRAAAMEAFVQKFPASVVKMDALEQAMAAYQAAGNQAQVEGAAKRILQADATHVRALAILSFLERAKATQGDKEALAAAGGHAQRGLAAIARWRKPDGMEDAEFSRLKDQMNAIFHGALGFVALNGKDYAKAREHLIAALRTGPDSLQDNYQLGIAELEMSPSDPTGFWYVARAINLARAQSNDAAAEGVAKYGKAKYRRFHGSDEGWDDLVKRAAAQSVPPAGFAATVKAAPTPAEIAVMAVDQNDPASLSFSDWEFILSHRDASSANKAAADRVWKTIQEKQKNGAARLKIPVKIVSVDRNTIEAAITEENGKANTADLHIVLSAPLQNPPKPGASIDVIGVLTDYTPNPFRFTMQQAELAAAGLSPR